MRALLFSLTVCCAAALTVGLMRTPPPNPYAEFPVASRARLTAMPFDWSLGCRVGGYTGLLQGFEGNPDRIDFMNDGGRARLILTGGCGEGSPRFVGAPPGSDGRFDGRVGGSGRYFPLFGHVLGTMHGPALVDGVPTVYIELRSVPRPGVTDPRSRRTWTGFLEHMP